MKRITSADNPIWKAAMRLTAKRERDRAGAYLAEGFHLLDEGVKSGAVLRSVFVRESLLLREPGLLDPWPQAERAAVSVGDSLFDRGVDTETPQGVLSVVEKQSWSEEAFFSKAGEGRGNLLLLDRLQDPGNVGTVLRTAEAAGFGGVVVLKGTADVYGPKAVRAAAGCLFRLPLYFAEDGEEALGLLKKRGKRVLASTPYGDRYYYDVDMRENVCLVIGNEAGGVCRKILDRCDAAVKIPMAGGAESLNAAVAAGILIFESARQAAR